MHSVRRSLRVPIDKKGKIMATLLNRPLTMLFAFALIPIIASLIVADHGIAARAPLDLPNGGRAIGEDEEDCLETILFYGSEFEGDGFFFCLDKSGSMANDSRLDTLKSEVVKALDSLTSKSEFGIVAFSTGWISWDTRPKRAQPDIVDDAKNWVNQLNAAGQTHLAPAGVETIRLSSLSRKKHKHIIVLSDGLPNGPGALNSAITDTINAITLANWERTPIHTIFIGDNQIGKNFMQTLALMNSGTFTQVIP